VIFVISRLGET